MSKAAKNFRKIVTKPLLPESKASQSCFYILKTRKIQKEPLMCACLVPSWILTFLFFFIFISFVVSKSMFTCSLYCSMSTDHQFCRVIICPIIICLFSLIMEFWFLQYVKRHCNFSRGRLHFKQFLIYLTPIIFICTCANPIGLVFSESNSEEK